jgi:hypothetical protein
MDCWGGPLAMHSRYADSCYVIGGYNLHTVFKAASDKNSTFHSHSGDEIMMGLGL